jgi:hypothetical protein
MKPVERGEVLGLAAYEQIREQFRARVIEEKKARRVFLGDRASCLFENHDTVLMQIQEMLRTERITREAAILHEIETYNELIAKKGELSATILVEIPEKEERDRFLAEAAGLEASFVVVVDGIECKGKVDPSRIDPARTTAVHYVKFDLVPAAEQKLRDVLEKRIKPGDLPIELKATHAKYNQSVRLPPALVLSLAEDLLE